LAPPRFSCPKLNGFLKLLRPHIFYTSDRFRATLIVTKGLLNVSSAKEFRPHFPRPRPRPRMGSTSQSPERIPTALRASAKASDGPRQKWEEDWRQRLKGLAFYALRIGHTGAKSEKTWESAHNFRCPSFPISAHSQIPMLQFCGPFISSTVSTRLPIAKPMLVDRLCSGGVWRLEHTMVDFKLFHEAIIGSAYGTAFTQLRKGFVR
jgi:hypothetical protein